MLELIFSENENYCYIPKYKIETPAPCLLYFPQFREDFEALRENKIITIDEKKRIFTWKKNQISLAQYFLDLEFLGKNIWSVVEPDFGIERGKLKQSISANKKQNSGKDSRDHAEIKKLLEPYREKAENIRKTALKDKYYKIRKMVIDWKEPSDYSELEVFCKELEKTISEINALF